MEQREHAMQQLADEIIHKRVCPELADQAIQLVMGSGNLNADIVFIGEAPGKSEDETGKPFVGAAGKFLDKMLEEAGMVRDDVYITNIVKYRPPKNRDPKPAEKAEFLPYLMRQLDIITPRVIITLGAHSTKAFLPDIGIGDAHGQLFDAAIEGRNLAIIPLYHPAYALYNGGLRQTLIDDFLKVPGYIKDVEVR